MPIRTYLAEEEAAAAWADRYRQFGEKKEVAALIYSMTVNGEKQYCFSRTRAGMKGLGPIRANVIMPFMYLYTIERLRLWLRQGALSEAFIHTHPQPPKGLTMRFHSPEDFALLKLPGIKAVYVVPFENHEVNRVGR